MPEKSMRGFSCLYLMCANVEHILANVCKANHCAVVCGLYHDRPLFRAFCLANWLLLQLHLLTQLPSASSPLVKEEMSFQLKYYFDVNFKLPNPGHRSQTFFIALKTVSKRSLLLSLAHTVFF